MYRNAEPEELAGLHPSDRLMVQLIKIERLDPRIEGMLYRRKFDETWTLLDDVCLCCSSLNSSIYRPTEREEVIGSRRGSSECQAFQRAAKCKTVPAYLLDT